MATVLPVLNDSGLPDPISSSISLSSSLAPYSSQPSSLVSASASSLSSESSSWAEITSTVTVTPLPVQTPSPTITTDTLPVVVIAPTVFNAGTTSSVTSSSSIPVATQSTTSKPSSRGSNVPIFAGAVSTFVGILLISLLIWFYLRRRKQKKQARKSVAGYGLPGKDYALGSPPDLGDQTSRRGDVFTEFGERYNTPRQVSALPANLATAAEGSMNIDTPIEVPLRDIEKSSLTPPPVHEHPAYQDILGESPDILPTYKPGQPIHSPLMTEHPAYHVSQLSQHPAFFCGPSTSPRQTSRPRRTSGVKRQKSSPRVGGRSSPNDIMPIVAQLPSGRSELEAVVPASYISPVNSPNLSREMRLSTQYNPQYYAPLRNNVSTRSTQASRHSMPGLRINSTRQQNTQTQTQHDELPNHPVLSPTTPNISPQSPFHLDTQYHPHFPYAKPISINNLEELREGREKEVVSSLSEGRWSEATCVGTFQIIDAMGGLGEPITAVECSEGDEYATWESWARR